MRLWIGRSIDPGSWVQLAVDAVCDYLRSIDPNRIGQRSDGEKGRRRAPTEKLSIWMLHKTAQGGYENIVDASSTFRVYCGGNMLACREKGCRDMISVGQCEKGWRDPHILRCGVYAEESNSKSKADRSNLK